MRLVVAKRCNLTAARSWTHSILQLQSLMMGKLSKRLISLGWQALIFWIWNERSGRLHHQNFRSSDAIIKQIDRQIRNRTTSYRDRNPTMSSKLLQLWLSTEAHAMIR
ncbi:unnamed protein product [Thlaspi arvense]|uniref:Uncharacterized protein n=1 Tax=Thlaspi arvense TaxID=13288 RepID=A0AAU9R948_THLAR|nr:unnamed protein product [Thlaspi arvense]